MKKFFLSIVCISLFLAGCSQKFLKEECETHYKPVTSSVFLTQQAWWQQFESPIINQLVQHALEQNFSLKAAIARIKEAYSDKVITQAGALGSFDIEGVGIAANSYTRNMDKNIQIGLKSAIPLDFAGSKRARFNSSDALLNATVEQAQTVKNDLIAAVVNTYITLYHTDKIIIEYKELLAIQEQELSLVSQLYQSGVRTVSDVEDASIATQKTAVALHSFSLQNIQEYYRLKYLLGTFPDDMTVDQLLENNIKNLSTPLLDNVLNIPVEHIKQHPTLQSLYFEIISAQANLKEAEANLWPQLSFSAFFGIHKSSLNFLVDKSPYLWSSAINLSQHVFNFGRLKAVVEKNKITVERKIVEYQNAIQEILQKSYVALNSYVIICKQKEDLLRKTNSHKKQVMISQQQQEKGLINKIDYLKIKESFLFNAIEIIKTDNQLCRTYTDFCRETGIATILR